MNMLNPQLCDHQRTCAVTHTPEFQKKGLGNHSLDGSLSCSHLCAYCTTPSILRTQSIFKEAFGKSAYEAHRAGDFVIDLDTPNRIAESAKDLTKNDTVILSPKTDLWCPTNRKYDLGKKCLKALLEANDECQVRLLSKSHWLVEDLKEFTEYRDRILVGFSLTAPKGKSHLSQIMEPNASTIAERLDALRIAKGMGFRVFAMICPATPGVLTDEFDLEALLSDVVALAPENIWLEGLNGRGTGLGDTEKAFRLAGRPDIADRIKAISTVDGHETYVEALIKTAHKVALTLGCADKMKYLVYDKLHAELKNVPGVIFLTAPWLKAKSLAPSDIKDDPNKPKRHIDTVAQADLEKSIRAEGILQPLHVREDNGKYILVAGTRRLLAAKAIKMKKIPVLIVSGDQAAEVSLKENVLREDLGPIELAESYKRFKDEAGCDQKDLAGHFGKVKSTISETLSLNNLPEDIKDTCRDKPKKYRLHHLKEIAKLANEADMRKAFDALNAKRSGKVAGQPKSESGNVLESVMSFMKQLEDYRQNSQPGAESKELFAKLEAVKTLIEELLKNGPEAPEAIKPEFEIPNPDVQGGPAKMPLEEEMESDLEDDDDADDEDDSDDEHEADEHRHGATRCGYYDEDDDLDPAGADCEDHRLCAEDQARLDAIMEDYDPFDLR